MKFGTLQVYPRQGLLQEHGLELPTAVIGRGEGAAIVIDDFSISRRHARLTIDSGRLLLEDLGSLGGTFVNGQRIEPGVRHLVEDDSELRFGEITARYIPPETAESTVPLDGEEPAGEVVQAAAGGLRLAVVSPSLPVEPGKRVTASASITNAGRIIDTVSVEIPDLPADWYTVDTPSIPILPGGRADVIISFHPPRRHDAISGEYSFTVVARSKEYDEYPEATGQLQVLPFEAVGLSLEAMRSKKNFRIVAENRGNDVVLYQLAGRDDEQAFRYWFETPAVELQPGQKRIINMTVRRQRQLMGPPAALPFEVVGTSAQGAEITARGQLAVNPPLQKFRMPAMFALMAMMLAATALAVLVITDGDGTKTASAEDKFAGVHLCEDKDAAEEQAEKNQQATNEQPRANATVVGPYDGGRPLFGQVDSNGAPFFAQSDPRWGGEEYARSTELPAGKDWCGTTIEQCGCAMTSVSVMLALYDLLQMPDGSSLSPKTLNDWFNGNARKTDRGWVSRGYIYGDVIWSAANELSGEIAKAKPGARTVRFVRTGSGSEDEIRADLQAGRPVIVEVPGHWIAAVGLDGDQILINDPFYRDRKTLDAYKGKVRSSVHYEPSSDLSAVVITAPADVKFKVTDKQGRVVATGDGTVEQPADVINQIPGASVAAKQAWRDPTCIETAPPPGAGTNQIVLPGARDDYVIEIVGTGNAPASVAVHTYGKDGASSIATIEGQAGTQADVSYDPNQDKPVINISTNGTPVPTATPPDADGAGGGDEDETPTPTPSPSTTPTATPTPFVEQRTAMTLPGEPGQTRVEVATNSGFELGDPIRFAPGQPNEEDNIIVGFGSFLLATPLKFAHSPGEVIARLPRPPGQGPGLPPGITPPPDVGPLVPPDSVAMNCSTLYQASPKLATFICDLQIQGTYTNTRWTLNGVVVPDFTGSTSFIMAFPADTPAAVSVTVCNQTLCRSATRTEAVQFPPNSNGTTQGGAGAASVPTPPPTPAAGAVVVTCGTEFDQNVRPTLAIITCTANFGGDFTSVSWSAPGGTPASQSGTKKTFETRLLKDDALNAALKVTATVCNFGNCRTSTPYTVGIGKTVITVTTEPQQAVAQRQQVTFFAAVFGLNGIVPQGGNVQFYADDGDPIGSSAQLFTVGGTSVAQTTIQASASGGALSTIGLHTVYAEYSGGVNAFGSVSYELPDKPPLNFEILPPIPDDCDSIDEDLNGDTDETCNFSTPENIGGGTILSSLSITGGTPDGAPNAVIASPGEGLFVSGTVSRTDYCPGCIRQVYFGIGANDGQPGATVIGPQCSFTGGAPAAPASVPTSSIFFNAPSAPGVYYIRASTTLNYFCVGGTSLGPPGASVGRIIVRSEVQAQIDVYLNDEGDTKPTSPWDNALPASPITAAEAGQRLLIRGRVPPGATGFLDVEGFTNLTGVPVAVVAQICPPSGDVPAGTFKGDDCVPGEARVLSPTLLDNVTAVNIRARYRNDNVLQLVDPGGGFEVPVINDYPVYLAPTGPGSSPDPYTVKTLVTSTTTLAAVPNPVDMGQSFTLTATVVSQNVTLGETGEGGIVKFMAGSNQIGNDVTVGPGGVATISWTPRTCNNYDANLTNNCTGTNEGFPFDSQDQKGGVANAYGDVHAVFQSGTSDLKASQSSNIDLDVNPAPSSITMTASPASITVGDSVSLTATATATGGFPVTGGLIQFKVRASTAGAGSAVNLGAAQIAPDSGLVTLTVSTGGDADAIQAAGSYVITAEFAGTSQVDTSVSADSSLTVGLAQPTVTVTLPAGGTITVGDSGSIRAVVAGSPANRLDDNPARLRLLDGSTELATSTISNLGGSTLGADFAVSGLAAGTYSITVEYVANAYFGGTTSAAQNFTINKHGPTVTLNSITAVQVGSSLTLSANVSGSGVRSPAGGSVSFYLGGTSGTLLGTDTTISGGGDVSISVPTGDGQTLSVAGTAYTNIVAHFNGDATNGNLNAATSSAGSVTLTKRDSTTAVTSGATTVRGSDLTLNATVSASSTPSSAVSVACTGCLQFQVDLGATTALWTDIGAAVDVSSAGAATTTVATGSGSFATAGTYRVRAVYAGQTNYNGSTASATNAVVTPPVPTVSITGTTITISSSGTVTATVVSADGASPQCSNCLQFKVGSTLASATVFATVSISAVGANFEGSTSILAGGTNFPDPGTYTIWATYTGNANVAAASSSSASVVINARPVSVTVSAATSVTLGNSITLTATLAPSTAPGTVRFFADGTEITGTNGVAADTSDGTTTFSWTPTSVGDGTATISATYTSSNVDYLSQATSTNDDVTINPAATTIAATAAQTGGAGTSITLTANITSGFGVKADIDGGTVTFTITAGAGTCTGTFTATVTDGVATATGISCPAGNNYNVRGSYSGAGNYAASADTSDFDLDVN